MRRLVVRAHARHSPSARRCPDRVASVWGGGQARRARVGLGARSLCMGPDRVADTLREGHAVRSDALGVARVARGSSGGGRRTWPRQVPRPVIVSCARHRNASRRFGRPMGVPKGTARAVDPQQPWRPGRRSALRRTVLPQCLDPLPHGAQVPADPPVRLQRRVLCYPTRRRRRRPCGALEWRRLGAATSSRKLAGRGRLVAPCGEHRARPATLSATFCERTRAPVPAPRRKSRRRRPSVAQPLARCRRRPRAAACDPVVRHVCLPRTRDVHPSPTLYRFEQKSGRARATWRAGRRGSITPRMTRCRRPPAAAILAHPDTSGVRGWRLLGEPRRRCRRAGSAV
jgi:hypothetical protein